MVCRTCVKCDGLVSVDFFYCNKVCLIVEKALKNHWLACSFLLLLLFFFFRKGWAPICPLHRIFLRFLKLLEIDKYSTCLKYSVASSIIIVGVFKSKE